MQSPYKYYAFISYSSKDTEWGKRLQRKLERYRMPATLCRKHGWGRTPIKPVFFAPTDIQPGGLTEELQERLKASRNLIVICSPNSAQSEWVGKEIEFFHKLGRTKQIHFFIVDGIPHSGDKETECFNFIIDKLSLPEILGANVNEKIYRWPWLNKERAYVQLISKLLGVEFDAIWNRHRRLLVRNAIAWLIGIVAVLSVVFGVWIGSQPVDVEMQLNEASTLNTNLPQLKDAIVTMELDNEVKTDTVASIDRHAIFKNIPHKYLNNVVHISVECRDFIPLDTTVTLTKKIMLNLYRDPNVYGDVRFQLWDGKKEKGVANVKVSVAGNDVVSDKDGYVTMFIPLHEQNSTYFITSEVPLETDSIYMPRSETDVICIK